MEITIDTIVEDDNTYYEMICSMAHHVLPGCAGCNCFRFVYSGGVVTNYWQGAGLAKSGENLYAATTEAECLSKMSALGLTPVDPERLVTEFIIDSGASKSFQLPTESGGTYDPLIWTKKKSAKVYTGDPINFTAYDDPKTLLSFADDDLYTVKITKIFEGFRFNNGGDKLKMQEFLSFGALKPGDNGGMLYGCSNLNLNKVRDVLNLADVTKFTDICRNSGITIIPNIGIWNILTIADASGAFNGITLPTSTYNELLIGWRDQSIISEITLIQLDAENSKYSAGDATTARLWLTALYLYTITDNGEEA